MKFFKEFRLNKFLLIFFIYSGIGAALAAFILDRYWSKNRAPVPVIIYSDSSGTPPKKISFDGTNTTDPEGEELQYSWLINDKKISSDPKFKYVFRNIGDYKITLCVEDESEKIAKKSIFIKIDPPNNVSSIGNALKHFNYKIGWNTSEEHEIKYHPIDVIKFVNEHTVMLYDFNGVSEIHAVLLEHKRKIFGIWKGTGRTTGEFAMIFDKDFLEATGWWSYDNSDVRYTLKLKRITSED